MTEELQLEYDLESPQSFHESNHIQPQPNSPINSQFYSYQKNKCFSYILRFLLLSSLVSIIIPYIPPLELKYLKTPYYIIPLSMFASFISFQVIPFLSTYIHQKELQLKDLIDKDGMRRIPSNSEIRLLNNPTHYIKLYKYSLCSFSSIFMGVLVYYLLFDLEHTSLNYIEIMGIVITYATFFNNIHQNVSRGVLFVLHYYKNYQENKMGINRNTENINIETISQSTHN